MIRESDGQEVFLINGKYLTDEEVGDVAIKMVKDVKAKWKRKRLTNPYQEKSE
jgi:hypothetical protein